MVESIAGLTRLAYLQQDITELVTFNIVDLLYRHHSTRVRRLKLVVCRGSLYMR
jgi:hypothetical protein